MTHVSVSVEVCKVLKVDVPQVRGVATSLNVWWIIHVCRVFGCGHLVMLIGVLKVLSERCGAHFQGGLPFGPCDYGRAPGYLSVWHCFLPMYVCSYRTCAFLMFLVLGLCYICFPTPPLVPRRS